MEACASGTCTPQPSGTALRSVGTTELCQILVYQSPPHGLLSFFPVIQHPRLPGTGALGLGWPRPAPLAHTLQLRPSCPSQPAGNTGLGVSSLLRSGQVPGPELCQYQQGLNPAPCTGLGCAYNPPSTSKTRQYKLVSTWMGLLANK